MIVHLDSKFSCNSAVHGSGLLNNLINKLPIELHLPGYQYCGPGTKLNKRLARGDPGVNKLDAACKDHDISYSKSKDIEERHIADKILQEKAWERVTDKDSSIGEKASAYLITNAMKVKRKLGMGLKKRAKKQINKHKIFKKVINNVKKLIKKTKPKNHDAAIQIAMNSAKNAFSTEKVPKPRIIPIPKTGGILPLIPIFAGLSALGALAGGAAGVAKTINDVKNAR